MSKTILVVDDEQRLVSLVRDYLIQAGYRVLTACNGKEALGIAGSEKPDLIILDLMMPEMDGYEFMRAHRHEANTPIILLTARVQDDEKVIGLELGADDYVTKPFRPRELLARVHAVLRRQDMVRPTAATLQAADITINRENRSVQVGERFVDLTPSEFDLLAAFLAAPGRAFTRAELIEKALGYTYDGMERTLDSHIKNLRKKVEADPLQPGCLETVFGVGYRLRPDGV